MYYFIVNLQARNGQCQRVWRTIEDELKALLVPYKVFFTEYSGHAIELSTSIIHEANGDSIIIVVVGGDGTLHEVVNGAVHHSNISIGFIPGGSGNDFSRGFQIPKNPKDALALILEGRFPIDVDTGKICTGKVQSYFINNMGVGFDATICEEVNHSKLKAKLNRLSLGSLVYAIVLIKLLFTYKSSDMRVNIDGLEQSFENVWFITIANQIYFGGGMRISPEASVTDGLLDLTVVQNLSRWKLLFVFITVFWGGHTHFREVKTYTGKSISIYADEKVLVHADGEVIGKAPVKVQVCENSLRVLAG
ncbi:lipid kinase, YegS/Rv2252/BmrU family [Mesobacillus persicus]|uniref:Lipid kinase, YegS/Rv2252/BmrU family n=1 Tax=Mesobacillus persicus TaxID=930146 RepID=A0A1H7Y015_9BACI|nr:diacylglycerol kinase family protein [Mesobacillus persicus]SEM39410.1 lipid kinase, YegS/Rv2252/BmrU family [Mesobacillus persicus]